MIFRYNQCDFYLSWDHHNLLEKNTRDKMSDNPRWIFKSTLRGSEAYLEKMAMYYMEIERIAIENPEEFENNWLNINLRGLKAQENTWNLLCDYVRTKDHLFLKDIRNFDDQLKSDYSGDSYSCYPIGKKFKLITIIPEQKNWYGKVIKSSLQVEIEVNTESINKIIGDVDRFTIHSTTSIIEFSDAITVKQ